MAKITLDKQFKNYLLSAYPIDESLLDHLLEDLGDYFAHDVQSYISVRHQQLKDEGLKNNEIYGLLQKELNEKRFAVPEMSIRQIRRAIYG